MTQATNEEEKTAMTEEALAPMEPIEVDQAGNGRIAPYGPRQQSHAMEAWTPKFALSVDEAVAMVEMRRQFMTQVMKPGVHYGTIPGAGDKPTLLKPGAQLLLSSMGLNPEFIVTERVFDLTGDEHGGEAFIGYEMTCRIFRQTGAAREDRAFVAEGIGSCNSWESKYRYRVAQRACPSCGAAAIVRSKYPPRGSAPNTPPGYWCNPKGGGCGCDFPDGYKPIEEQITGRVPNPDVADQANTIKKMAAKRALVDATLNATGCSDIFTQDVEDGPGGDDDPPTPPRAPVSSNPAFQQAANASIRRAAEDVYPRDPGPTIDPVEWARRNEANQSPSAPDPSTAPPLSQRDPEDPARRAQMYAALDLMRHVTSEAQQDTYAQRLRVQFLGNADADAILRWLSKECVGFHGEDCADGQTLVEAFVAAGSPS